MTAALANVPHNLDEVAQAMADLWGQMETGGHTAVTADLFDFEGGNSGFDASALAAIDFDWPSGRGRSVVPLSDVRNMIRAGATVVNISAPDPRPPIWIGLALSNDVVVVALDVRRLPTAAPRDPGYLKRLTSHQMRSGIPEVNRRRKDAIKRLMVENGGRGGRTVARCVVVSELMDWFESPRFVDWVVSVSGEVIASRAPTTARGNVADRISDALMIEAFGATRHDRLAAVAQKRMGSMNPAIRQPDQKAEILSEYTRRMGGSDPTGNVAARAVDGDLSLGRALADTLEMGALIEAWRSIGCTERQVQVLFLTGIGFTQDEAATVLKIARSTVAGNLRSARKKFPAAA